MNRYIVYSEANQFVMLKSDLKDLYRLAKLTQLNNTIAGFYGMNVGINIPVLLHSDRIYPLGFSAHKKVELVGHKSEETIKIRRFFLNNPNCYLVSDNNIMPYFLNNIDNFIKAYEDE